MPIIINEIEISVTVSENQPTQQSDLENIASRTDIIKECVEQVMELIRQKNER